MYLINKMFTTITYIKQLIYILYNYNRQMAALVISSLILSMHWVALLKVKIERLQC